MMIGGIHVSTNGCEVFEKLFAKGNGDGIE
jgi:hypothetical protein